MPGRIFCWLAAFPFQLGRGGAERSGGSGRHAMEGTSHEAYVG